MDNELLALPVSNDGIKKADQVIINEGLLQGDDVIYTDARISDNRGISTLKIVTVCLRGSFFRFYSMLDCKYVVCIFWFVFLQKADLNKYLSQLQDPVTPLSLPFFGDNLHEKLKKF